VLLKIQSNNQQKAYFIDIKASNIGLESQTMGIYPIKLEMRDWARTTWFTDGASI